MFSPLALPKILGGALSSATSSVGRGTQASDAFQKNCLTLNSCTPPTHLNPSDKYFYVYLSLPFDCAF